MENGIEGVVDKRQVSSITFKEICGELVPGKLPGTHAEHAP
jgi:hypothetical protein